MVQLAVLLLLRVGKLKKLNNIIMNYSAVLNRFIKSDKFIIGKLIITNSANHVVFTSFTLELPYLNNQPRISSIPIGIYSVKRIVSPHNGNCYEILKVPNRSNIEIHIANYTKDILGCIGIGTGYFIPNNYQDVMITNSSKAMQQLLACNIETFDLKITESC